MRLRLHAIAAYVRKHATVEDVRNTTGVSLLVIQWNIRPNLTISDGDNNLYLLWEVSKAVVAPRSSTSICRKAFQKLRILCELQS